MDDIRRQAREIAIACGSLEQALIDSGIKVRHRDLAGLSAIYYPRGALALDGTSGPLATLLPLAHHFLKHRLLRAYPYGPAGAVRYSSPREEVEAHAWAQAFTEEIEKLHG